jgi:CheY-like chemotaxis protein
MNEYILVVDDQPVIRRLIEEVLWDSGYQAKSVANGKECLKIARSAHKPSLILLDHHMPLMSGMEVLSALKGDGATRGIPVIMLTADQDLEERAKAGGVDALLVKPPDIGSLIDAVQEAMAKHSPETRGSVI